MFTIDSLKNLKLTELKQHAKGLNLKLSYKGRQLRKNELISSILFGNTFSDYIYGKGVDFVSDIPVEDLGHIVNMLATKQTDKFDNLGSGSYGDVYGYKGYAIKKINHGVGTKDCNDVQVLKDLYGLPCIPKLYAVIGNDTLIVERINGATVKRFCNSPKRYENINVDATTIKKWENALTEVVLKGYNPDDLHDANVMIEEGTNDVKFVDVGWFHKHDVKYDKNDKDRIRNNYGYSRAEDWAGRHLRDYIRRMANIAS